MIAQLLEVLLDNSELHACCLVLIVFNDGQCLLLMWPNVRISIASINVTGRSYQILPFSMNSILDCLKCI